MHHLRTTLLDFAKAFILLVVIGAGAATISAQSDWTPPTDNTSTFSPPTALPPAGNAAAPINVSINPQRKTGSLFVGTTATLSNPLRTTFDVLGLASTTMLSTDNLLVSKAATFVATPVGSPMKLLTFTTQGLTIADGTQGAGKVLTSDAYGRATWQTPTGGASSNIVYDSGWISSGGNNHTQTITHNLGTTAVSVSAYVATDASGSNSIKTDNISINSDGNAVIGLAISITGTNTISISSQDYYRNGAGNYVSWAGKYVRVVVVASGGTASGTTASTGTVPLSSSGNSSMPGVTQVDCNQCGWRFEGSGNTLKIGYGTSAGFTAGAVRSPGVITFPSDVILTGSGAVVCDNCVFNMIGSASDSGGSIRIYNGDPNVADNLKVIISITNAKASGYVSYGCDNCVVRYSVAGNTLNVVRGGYLTGQLKFTR